MKKFIDFVEDGEEYEDEESEDESESEEIVEKRTLRNNFQKKEKKEGFDEDDFDVKVAHIIVNIHRKGRRDDKFSSWVEENLSHLNNLYSLSSLSCHPIEFYNYIYENSRNKQIVI